MLKLRYKLGHYAGIMLDALTMPLCPKLCRHNASNPTYWREIFTPKNHSIFKGSDQADCSFGISTRNTLNTHEMSESYFLSQNGQNVLKEPFS